MYPKGIVVHKKFGVSLDVPKINEFNDLNLEVSERSITTFIIRSNYVTVACD